MQKNRSLQVTLLAVACVSAALLVLGIVQLNSLEKQVIVQAQQLRSLGEATEKVSGELKRIQSGSPAVGKEQTDGVYPDVKLLHPEVENFLEPRDTHWPPEGATTDGVLARGWSTGDPKGFNLVIENAADLTALAHYIIGRLAQRNRWTDPNKWHGDLAWRTEITNDFKEYTFYLRQDIKWHPVGGVDLNDPKYEWLNKEHTLTAHDFVFALDMILHPQVENGALKNYYQEIESYEAIDNHTLVVRWKKKTYQSLTATLSLYPLPRFLYAFAEDGTEHPKETLGLRFNQHWYNNKGIVGVGPYRFVSYQPGVKIVVERNEDYFGEKPAIKRFDYPIYTDSKQTVLKLKASELNFGGLRPSQYREEVQKWQGRPKDQLPKNNPFTNGNLICETSDYPAYSYIGWNGDKAIFKDPRVRTAMTLALNREDLVDKVFVGLGSVANGPFLPSTGYLDPDIDPLAFDLERAKKLLAEAGWSDTDGDGLLDKEMGGQRQPFEFTLLIVANSPEYTSLSNIFKEDLLKIGVKMKVEAAEWSLMQKRMNEKQFDAFTGGWAMGWENDPYQLWHSSQADVPKGSNRVGFRNPEADTIIEKLRDTFDPAERKRMFRRLHRLIYDAQAYSFLRVVKAAYCWHKDVQMTQLAKVFPIADSNPWWVASAN